LATNRAAEVAQANMNVELG
jgi:hypothetical protein